MAKKLKKCALQIVPANDTELEQMIARIGQAQGRIDEKTAVANQKKAQIDDDLAGETADDVAFVKSAHMGVTSYVEANRDRLTPKGKKTITLKSGVIEYRSGVLSISVKGAEDVIQGLKDTGNSQFVTVKESVNKQAILDHIRTNGLDALPDVAGLSVSRGGETIDIKPNVIQEDVGNE